MIPVPNDARLELYGLQVICASVNLSYIDHIWAQRYSDDPKPLGDWPYRPAAHKNVTTLKTKREK